MAQVRQAAASDIAARMIGMYVHQHWSFNHPYAARTWTVEDWRGYLDGLHRLGYTAVLVWPVLEVMPDPLTQSDRRALEKTRRVIDLAHQEFGLSVHLALCPNVGPRDEEARKYPFEERPFFYCDVRVDPGDASAMDSLLRRRRALLAPLAQADGVFIIDSDPGGYPGSTNRQFIDLLVAHRRLLDGLRPGIGLTYWVHVGWQAYCDYYRTGDFRWGTREEIEETLSLLAAASPEPWGLANGLDPARRLGLAERVLSFAYGAVEGEPTYPLSNHTPEELQPAAQSSAPRGVMANAQCHCVQLPNTFAFARLARGLTVEPGDYEAFGDGLLAGQGALLRRAWEAPTRAVPAELEGIAAELDQAASGPLQPGLLAGLLFGDGRRLLRDLAPQLRLRAAFRRLDAALEQGSRATGALAAALQATKAWQGCHGYRNAWNRPELVGVLRKVGGPALEKALDRMSYRGEGATPWAQIQDGYHRVETFGPRLLAALEETLAARQGG
ncbi:MAG: hypothetical protein AB1505_07905 [Candidatus Latescibacterota bacterium]